MSGKASRVKGLSFERWVANELKHIFPKAKRHLEFQFQECSGFDIDNTGKLKIQCKAYKDYAPISKIEEVKESGIPCLVTKGDRKPPMIVLPFAEFIKIIEDIGYLYEGNNGRVHKDCKD